MPRLLFLPRPFVSLLTIFTPPSRPAPARPSFLIYHLPALRDAQQPGDKTLPRRRHLGDSAISFHKRGHGKSTFLVTPKRPKKHKKEKLFPRVGTMPITVSTISFQRCDLSSLWRDVLRGGNFSTGCKSYEYANMHKTVYLCLHCLQSGNIPAHRSHFLKLWGDMLFRGINDNGRYKIFTDVHIKVI